MKLVDILARELKVWPDDEYHSIGQASNGTLHKSPNWDIDCGWTKESYTMADDWPRAFVYREEWQAAVDALKAPPEEGHAICRCECGTAYQWPANASCPECVDWNGEGLPPVGTVCEHQPYEDQEDWHQVEIIAHKNTGLPVAVFWDEAGQRATYSSHEAFRPIRTPEQIVAEQLRNDELMYGTSYAVKGEDGSLERIDPTKIIIRHRGA